MTVGCVVAFLFQPAINCFRSHVVQFGEKTVKDVIRVWNDKKDQVKTGLRDRAIKDRTSLDSLSQNG